MTAQAGSANERLKAILKAGKLFEGKYRILRPLGAGSFAVVVHARHEVMGRDVALKFLKPKVVSSNPEVSERFVKEVQIASRLKHPNVVAIYDFGVSEEGIYYMVQEFVDGVTVDELFPVGRPLPQARVLDMLGQVLDCLNEAHGQGIVHRDLKPSNLMSTKGERGEEVVKILDFGVAKLLEPNSSGSPASQIRQSTKFIGTPIYMSPEQILGREVTPASDLYSVGLMCYEMLTGQPPIQAEQIAEVVQQHLSDAPFDFPLLHLLEPHIQKAILTATSREANERFQSAEQFWRALEARQSDASSAPSHAPPSIDRRAEEKEDDLDVFLGKNYIGVGDVSSDVDSFAPLSPEQQRQSRQRSTGEFSQDDLFDFSIPPASSAPSPRPPVADRAVSRPPAAAAARVPQQRVASPDSIPFDDIPSHRPSAASAVPGPERSTLSGEFRRSTLTAASASRTSPDRSTLSGEFRRPDTAPSGSGIHRTAPEKKPIASSQNLELDMTVVRSVRQQRHRQTIHDRQRARQDFEKDTLQSDGSAIWAWVLVILGLSAFSVNMILLCAVTDGMASAMRLLVGVSPLLICAALVAFKSNRARGPLHGWMEPIAIRLLVMLAVSFVGVALVYSGQAAIALRHEGAFLFELFPEVQPFVALGKVSQGIANGMAGLFEALAKILPDTSS